MDSPIFLKKHKKECLGKCNGFAEKLNFTENCESCFTYK